MEKKKTNCWEFKECGREINGVNSKIYGVCSAASFDLADGFLGGKNGGRACFYITGTFCSGRFEGTKPLKEHDCENCDFHKLIGKEEGSLKSLKKFNHYVMYYKGKLDQKNRNLK